MVSLGFLVVCTSLAYNVILRRSRLNALRAVISTYHLLVKFPTKVEVREIRGDQLMARQYYLVAIKGKKLADILNIEAIDTQDKQELHRGELMEDIIEVSLDKDHPTQTIRVGSNLSLKAQAQVVEFLRNHSDVFVWSPIDMLGIDPEVISHSLNVDLAY